MMVWCTTVYYELIKYSRMRSVLILLIGLPLLLILLLGSAFDTEIKPAKVALYVADHGEMRESIDQLWNDDAIKPYVKVLDAGSEKEVQDWVREGIADYGVHIPVNFSKQISAGETASWFTYLGRYEEKNMAAEAVVNGYLGNANMRMAALRTLGPAASEAFDDDRSSTKATESPILTHNLGYGDNQGFGKTSAIQYYSAAYLIMFLLYGGMSAAIALLNQRESGTLQRLYAIPSSFKANVFGIIAGAMLLAVLQAVIIVAFTTFVYGVDWGGHLGWIALICLFTIAAGAGFAIIVSSFVRSKKTLQSLFTIIVFSMTFVSGGMVTGIDQMIGSVGKFTINYWANESLREIMSNTGLASVSYDVGILGLIALALTIIAVIRMPKVVKYHA
jgi:ABC-2 type transport system permease protein